MGIFCNNDNNSNSKKLAAVVVGDQNTLFLLATNVQAGGTTPFPGFLYYIVDMYIILLSVKQVPFLKSLV